MNKKTLIVILLLIIIISAGVTYVLLRKDDGAQQTDAGVPSSADKGIQEQKTEEQGVKGIYADYSEEGFAAEKGVKLLFFYAPWCPQCRALDESIRTSELPDNTIIFKVDYDSHQALRAKYGVTIQTTVVKVDGKGDKLSSYVAYDEPTFESVKQALLP